MTALIVVGVIAGILALPLIFSITLYVSITEDVRMKVGMFGLRFDIMSPEKDLRDERKAEKKKAKPKKKKKKKKESGAKKTKAKEKKKPKNDFAETVHFVLDLVHGVFPSAVRLLRRIRLTALSFRMAVGSGEPDKTAMTYTAVSAGAYNVVALLKSQITVKIKEIDIRPDFLSGNIRQDIRFKMKIRGCFIIAGAAGILYNILKVMFRRGDKGKQSPDTSENKKTKIKEGAVNE